MTSSPKSDVRPFLRWAADGKGWFAWNLSAAPPTHIHVDLQGRSYLLRQQAGTLLTWSVPSPDGRHLAFREWNPSTTYGCLKGFKPARRLRRLNLKPGLSVFQGRRQGKPARHVKIYPAEETSGVTTGQAAIL
jgi:hypothetical protein